MKSLCVNIFRRLPFRYESRVNPRRQVPDDQPCVLVQTQILRVIRGGGGCQVISHVTQTTVYHYGITLDMFGMMAEPISPSEGIMFNWIHVYCYLLFHRLSLWLLRLLILIFILLELFKIYLNFILNIFKNKYW